MNEHSEKKSLSRSGEKKSLLLALFLTASIMVLEFFGGIFSNSIALISDAGHMLTDTLALALSLFAVIFATRPATAKKTYGYYRLEILAALLNGVILTVIALVIFYKAYLRILSPQAIKAEILLSVAFVGLLANIIGLFILHKKRSNLNVRGAFLHILGDTLSSIGVIIGGIIILLTGWVKVDAIIGIVIGAVIIYGSFRLIKESVDILLEAAPSGIETLQVSEAMKTIEGIKEVHHLHIWCITTGLIALSGHIVLEKPFLAASDDILKRIREMLHDRFQINHATIQIESEDYFECGDEPC
jgi:cobalt-zinc-cadmium efflux system protein